MKKALLLSFIIVIGQIHAQQALDGLVQAQVEKLYDRFIESVSDQTMEADLKKINKKLNNYLNSNSNTGMKREMIRYMNHLLCMKISLVEGTLCHDGYYPESDLTKDIAKMSLEQRRKILIREHNNRRESRGIGLLTRSSTLDTIAQNYALKLCAADTIDHELNGSTLTQRYEEGGYDYLIGAENLGYGQTTIAELLDQLTTSISHRENMYLENVDEVGVGQCGIIWVINYGVQ